MERKLLLIGAFIWMGTLHAQTFEYVDINNIKARVNCSEMLFNNSFSSAASFEVPIGSGKNMIFAASLCMGGMDFNNQLKLSFLNNNQYGNDFQPGPIMHSSQYASQVPQWNRVWKIYKSEIDNHILNWSTMGYVAPPDFISWPAHGNVSMGMAFDLAPYFDYNADNAYNPYDGDYPLINGDVAVFFIMNDDKIHLASGGTPIGAEVHVMAYAVDCASDSILANTVFVNMKIINRSTQPVYNFSASMLVDGDLGCYQNDYVGCDVSRSMYYYYNGDDYDPNCSGTFGYDSLVPRLGMVVLGGLTRDADGIDNSMYSTAQTAINNGGICYPLSGVGYNDNIIDNERYGLTNFIYYNNSSGPTGNPASPNDYYDYMNSIWPDGSFVYFNGSGYYTDPNVLATGSIQSNFMFPGYSDPLNWGTYGIVPSIGIPWTETSSANPPGDRRSIASAGKTTFIPGAVQQIDMAYVFAANYQNPSDSANAVLLNIYTDSLHSYFRHNQSPCGGFLYAHTGTPEQNPIKVSVYPNPSDNIITVATSKTGRYIYRIYDISGKEIMLGNFLQSTQINVNSLSDGMYTLHVINELNQITVHKLVIN